MDEQFAQELLSGKDCECPTCGRYAKLYRRRIHHTVAAQLVRLFALGGQHRFIHTRNLLPNGATGTGDFCKAKYWGLIEEGINTDTSKKQAGHWRLTEAGVEFVTGLLHVPKVALVYDDRVMGFDTKEQVGIHECLGDYFNYQELMEA